MENTIILICFLIRKDEARIYRVRERAYDD